MTTVFFSISKTINDCFFLFFEDNKNSNKITSCFFQMHHSFNWLHSRQIELIDMYFQWYSLYFLSFHSFWTRANTLITENHFSSSSNIELYQCETDRTTPISSYIFVNETFGSCEPDCCVNVNSNDTSIFSCKIWFRFNEKQDLF